MEGSGCGDGAQCASTYRTMLVHTRVGSDGVKARGDENTKWWNKITELACTMAVLTEIIGRIHTKMILGAVHRAILRWCSEHIEESCTVGIPFEDVLLRCCTESGF